MSKNSMRTLFSSIVFSLVAALTPSTVTFAANTSSISLNGSSQYFSIADESQAELDTSADMTIEAWIKPVALPINDFEDRAIVEKWNGDSGSRSYFLSLDRQGGVQYVLFWNSPDCTLGDPQIKAAYTFPTGRWSHVAVVKNGMAATIYVNGTAIGTGNVSSGICNSTATLGIGANISNGPSQYFNGSIDDVRVWNVARSGTDIVNDMSTELTGNEAGLVGYWKFNGSSLLDSTANHNNLTNNGGATFSSDTPFPGTLPPTITITNPSIGVDTSKTLIATTSAGTLTMSTTTSSTCDGSLSFSSYVDLIFTHASDNGTRTCYQAIDGTETSYALSDAIAGITDPPAPAPPSSGSSSGHSSHVSFGNSPLVISSSIATGTSSTTTPISPE